MSIYDEIYETAFEDELQKLAAAKDEPMSTKELLVPLATGTAGKFLGNTGAVAGLVAGGLASADMKRKRMGEETKGYTPVAAGLGAGTLYGHLKTRKTYAPLNTNPTLHSIGASGRNFRGKVIGGLAGAGIAGLGSAAYRAIKNKDD